MSFPTKKDVALRRLQKQNEANDYAINVIKITAYDGRMDGEARLLGSECCREDLIAFFAMKTEWRLSFCTKYVNGDEPNEAVEYWRLS